MDINRQGTVFIRVKCDNHREDLPKVGVGQHRAISYCCLYITPIAQLEDKYKRCDKLICTWSLSVI